MSGEVEGFQIANKLFNSINKNFQRIKRASPRNTVQMQFYYIQLRFFF